MDNDGNGADNDNGGAVAPVVSAPSISDMIDASVNDGDKSRATTLDRLVITFDGPAGSNDNDEGESDSEPVASVVIGDVPKRRGRPKGSTNGSTAGTASKKKAEIAADLAAAQAENASLRARMDTGKIDELAKSITLACYLSFGMAAEARGPHWKIGEDEAQQIGETGAHALAPYADQIAAKLPWGMFLMTLSKAIYVRVEVDRKAVAELRASGDIP